MGLAIQKMFDSIAGRYDFLNHFLSAGRDRVWRKKASGQLQTPNVRRLLDLCGGTGDFWQAWEMSRGATEPEGVGVIADFSMGMLLQGKAKFSSSKSRARCSPHLVRMDALQPCFRPGTFDAVVCGYGMRNLDSTEVGIDQVRELLRPGGTFVTLEFFRPTTLFTRLFYNVLAPLGIPVLGWAFASRREAYVYLVTSIRKFFSAHEYKVATQNRGFTRVQVIPCDFGISHIITAVKA